MELDNRPYTCNKVVFSSLHVSVLDDKILNELRPLVLSLHAFVACHCASYRWCVNNLPILVAARSKAWVCGRSLAGIVGSKPTGGMDVCLVSAVCCQVEVSASG